MRIIDADELVKYLKKYHGMSQGVISDVEHFPTAHMAIEALEKQATSEWIPCSKRLPKRCEDVILTFKETFHTHESYPRIAVMPAWICNVDEENPEGMWAIEGRLGNYVVDIESGIAWMPLPEPYKDGEQE